MSKITLAHFPLWAHKAKREITVVNRPTPSGWKRRGFIGSALVASGAALGWVVRRSQVPDSFPAPVGRKLDPQFAYDVSEFETTDPELLRFEPVNEFPTGMARPKRLATWPGRGVVVAGDRSLKFFDEAGTARAAWPLEETPHCLHLISPEELLVGYADRFATYNSSGQVQRQSPSLGRKTYLTSLAALGDRVFAADAGNREVIIADRQIGEVLQRFGKKDAALGNPGFNVPSPYFALALAPDQRLRVVNPGLLRVETYTLDGRFVSAWGEPGMRIDRFCGCCNPVYFALTNGGDFVTSEKGLGRINLYTKEGVFKGAVAGPETLVTDKKLAKKACKDCTVGAGFDIAVADNGDVLVLDPYRKFVRRFQPKDGA